MKYLQTVSANIFLLLGMVSIIIGCGGPYSATNRVYKKQVKAFAKTLRQYPLQDTAGIALFTGTTNLSMRKPNFIIIHHTAQNSCEQTLTTFTLPRTQVSAHYVIAKDGRVYHMLSDYLRAHHAGISRWGNTTDLNSCSIGIELDNNGYEYFTEPQLQSLLQLLQRLKNAFGIPTANFIGHGDIAPTRKNDPNWRFPWQQLANKGFGLWYGDTTNITVPSSFHTLDALRIVGFDTKDSNAAKLAFNRHFLQDTTSTITPAGQKVLYQLYKKY
jgi:N-acetylmuramoyl-L-alanine amidase